jgi:hypothetical protein
MPGGLLMARTSMIAGASRVMLYFCWAIRAVKLQKGAVGGLRKKHAAALKLQEQRAVGEWE